jgi:hypothetical protein
MLLNIGTKKKVFSPAGLNNFIKARIIDQKLIVVPCINSRLGDVNYYDLNGGAFKSYHSHGWATHIPSFDATQLYLMNPAYMLNILHLSKYLAMM